MFLYVNNQDHAIALERFHYNYLNRDENARMQMELRLSDSINDDIDFLVSLADLPITHIVIKREEDGSALYDIAGDFVIDTLSDDIDNGERRTNLAFAKVEEAE